jgi:DNA-directed RNA polymerase specialized sigma24 family protein
MNPPLEDLLEQLSSGDMEAAERVFVAYEPYLRQAVRRHLSAPFRAKFDSADIVQSTWADLLRGFREAGWRFADVDHLSGFLFVATRNRLIDRIRQYQQAVECEVPLGEGHQQELLPSPRPRPSEVAQANEIWERILTRCPPEHRPLLGLKRQG